MFKVLKAWRRPLSRDAARSRCPCASYRVTPSLLQPENRSFSPSAKKRERRVLLPERSVQTPGASDHYWRKRNEGKVSPELGKPGVRGSPGAEERQRRQKARLDSDSESHEIVFGISPCLLALRRGRRKASKLFVKDGEAAQRASVLRVCEEARSRGVPICHVSKKDLDKMCLGRVHQGVCLQASRLDYCTTASSDDRTTGHDLRPPLWLVLEGVQDPMNLGAILRSAYFLGVDRVASSVSGSCPLSPVVSKASSGAMEVMEVHGYESLGRMLGAKAAQGWQVVGSVGPEAEGTRVPVIRCSDFRLSKPTLLLVGGEGEGLSGELLSRCQALLTIPAGRDLFPGIESLNVSVAAAVLLHSLLFPRSTDR